MMNVIQHINPCHRPGQNPAAFSSNRTLPGAQLMLKRKTMTKEAAITDLLKFFMFPSSMGFYKKGNKSFPISE